MLWAAGPLMLLIAAGVGVGYLRGRAKAPSAEQAPLSAQEQARLDDILKR
jgi:cytochrome c-type biogenesis protein CcmH